MLRILPCYAVRWKKRIRRTRPRQRKATWQTIKAPLGRTSVLACTVILLFGASAAPAAENDGPLTSAERGRVLFVRQWAPNDELTPKGDGLGPMYNARSCVACHNQGGAGGSGSLDRNVELLSLSLPQSVRVAQRGAQFDQQRFADRIADIHPGFVGGSGAIRPNITLHRFGATRGYDAWRAALLAAVDLLQDSRTGDRIGLQAVQRRTPSLFGVGLIDSIDDKVLEETAHHQASRKGPIKGQVARARGGAGKFGWRGQTARLREFVMGACANELGLQVSTDSQAADPLKASDKTPGLDLTNDQCYDLVAFVAGLTPPKPRPPWNHQESKTWEAGAQLFTTVGCAECHMRKLGTVDGIYSDLLLHDMGNVLSDSVPASSSGSGYYGGSQDVFVEVPPVAKRQWRTPPLWSAAVSAPYLHDGRAPTLDGAILNHGGEAEMARKKYAALTPEDRAKMLAFLDSLGAQPASDLVGWTE